MISIPSVNHRDYAGYSGLTIWKQIFKYIQIGFRDPPIKLSYLWASYRRLLCEANRYTGLHSEKNLSFSMVIETSPGENVFIPSTYP